MKSDDNSMYKALLENLPQKIFYKDTDSVYVLCNQNYADDLDIQASEIAGKNDFDFYPEDLAEKYRHDDRNVMESGEIQEFDEDIVTPKGHDLNIHTVKSPVKDSSGKIIGVLGIFWDITANKQAEIALRKQADQFMEMFNHFPEILYVTDPRTHEVLFVNNVWKEMLGKDPTGGICYKEFQGLDSKCDFCTDDIILKSRKPYSWEYYNPTVQKHFWITDQILKWPDGRDVRFEVAVDITARKQAEEALKERVKELNCLFEISKIANQKDQHLDKIIQSIADVIPHAWQYSDIACTRIQINSNRYVTQNFRETQWKQSSVIRVFDAPCGTLDVYYLEEKPDQDEGPFLKEERELINTIAEQTGKIVERIQSEEELRNRRDRLEELIKQQTDEIMELSTPVMQIWDGIITAPLIGTLDSQRTQHFMDRILETISQKNAQIALIDITGVPAVDTQTAQNLIETITACRLLGARVVLTGVQPDIAQAMVHLGIDLSTINTYASLATGLKMAIEFLSENPTVNDA